MAVGIKDLRDKGDVRLDLVAYWLTDLVVGMYELSSYVKRFPNLPVCLDVVKVRESMQLEWRWQGSTKRVKPTEIDESASEWISGNFLSEFLRVNAMVVMVNTQVKLLAKVHETQLGFENGWPATDLHALAQSSTTLPDSVLDALDTVTAQRAVP